MVCARCIYIFSWTATLSEKLPSQTFLWLKDQINRVCTWAGPRSHWLPVPSWARSGKMRQELTRSQGCSEQPCFQLYLYTVCSAVVVLGLGYEWGHGHFSLKEAPSPGNQGGLWWCAEVNWAFRWLFCWAVLLVPGWDYGERGISRCAAHTPESLACGLLTTEAWSHAK